MAGPQFAKNKQKVDWEDGTSSFEPADKAVRIPKTPRPGEEPHGVGGGVLSREPESALVKADRARPKHAARPVGGPLAAYLKRTKRGK